MTMAPTTGGGGGGSASSLADVIDTILDKGLVIDAYVSVGLIGIEILTINARVVIASVDTYLRFAEAANRLDLASQQGKGLPDVTGGAKGAIAGKAGQKMIAKAGDRLMDKAGDVLERIAPPERERSHRGRDGD